MKTVYDPRSVTLSGQWQAVVTGPDGQIKDKVPRDRDWGSNVVCTNGKEFLASYLYSATTGQSWTMYYVAVGTDSTAEAAANTALGTELARHTGTATYTSGAIYEIKATFTTGVAVGAVAEYGIFSANSGGTMLCRDTESVINVGANDTLTVTAQLTFS